MPYIITIELVIVVILLIYMIYIKKQISNVISSKEKVEKLYILKKIVEISSETTSTDEKIIKLNDTIIDEFKLLSSSIIYFDGIDFLIKSTNLEEKDTKKLLQIDRNNEIKDAIEKNNVIYTNFEDIKNILFCPLYYENIFVGYWILKEREDFKISKDIVEILRKAIREMISSLSYETSLEQMTRTDYYSNLKTNEYMLTEGRNILDKYDASEIAILKITNLVEINDEISRDAGNKTIILIANEISNFFEREKLDTIVVRYMGPKFVIAFPGVTKEKLEEKDIISKLKDKISKLENNPKVEIVTIKYTKGSEIGIIENRLEKIVDKKVVKY